MPLFFCAPAWVDDQKFYGLSTAIEDKDFENAAETYVETHHDVFDHMPDCKVRVRDEPFTHERTYNVRVSAVPWATAGEIGTRRLAETFVDRTPTPAA